MKVVSNDPIDPLNFEKLPQEIQAVCNLLRDGLKVTLNDNLYGIYLYGAVVFPETRYIQDVDFHVIVKRKLTANEKECIQKLHEELVVKFPQFRDELDGYYILQSDAQTISTPWHQIYPDLPDETWPLHVAHMRAGYCIVLCGPDPGSFLPEPTWQEITVGLDAALKHTLKHLETYPDYCILNFCRLLYSYSKKDVVISKRAAAEWVMERFLDWRQLACAAVRVYEREEQGEDRRLLNSEIKGFYQFMCGEIKKNKA